MTKNRWDAYSNATEDREVDARIARVLGFMKHPPHEVWFDGDRATDFGIDEDCGAPFSPTSNLDLALWAARRAGIRRRMPFSLSVDRNGLWRARFARYGDNDVEAVGDQPRQVICEALLKLGDVPSLNDVFRHS